MECGLYSLRIGNDVQESGCGLMLGDSRYLPAGSMEDPVNIITGLQAKTTLDLRTEAGLLIT